jgi:hypothetical protein
MTTQLSRIHEPSPQQAEHDEIKALIEPYWHLFNLALDHERKRQIIYITVTKHSSPNSAAIITQYLNPVLKNGKWIKAAGANTYPTDTASHIRRQSQKFNWCDASIQIFLFYLSPLMDAIGVKIEWLAVLSRPRVVFHFSHQEPNPGVRHSVFLITARSRRQFIADFTVEQFGFETCMWFMDKDEYVRTCMLDEAVVQPMEEELERARRGFFSPKLGVGWVVTVVVMKEEFRLWGRLDRKSRMMYLERVVKEVSEREYGDKMLPPPYSSLEVTGALGPEGGSIPAGELPLAYHPRYAVEA